MSTTTAILCAFGVYLLLMIGIGVWCMKKTTGADDYFLAQLQPYLHRHPI